MDSDAKLFAIVLAVLAALVLIASTDDSPPDDYYPTDMNSCIYTGVGGWDC